MWNASFESIARNRLSDWVFPFFHHGVSREHGSSAGPAGVVDDPNILLVARGILEAGIELRIEQDERRLGRSNRRHAFQQARAERSLVLADHGVVRADLPNHQIRLARQGALQPDHGGGDRLASDSCIVDLDRMSQQARETELELRRIGEAGSGSADPL